MGCDFGSMVSMIGHVRAGTLRPLAVTTVARSEALPDVPTVAEFVPGYEASDLFGLGAPKTTPAEIVGKLNAEVNAWLADPRVKARLADFGGIPVTGSGWLKNSVCVWASMIGKPRSSESESDSA